MHIEVIPLSQLQTDTPALLSKCCDSGRALVVELPDHRLVAIQSLEPSNGDDSLIDDLIESNPSFRALLEKSKASPRKPFVPGPDA
ncbi:MAG: hypothetical protein HYS13_20055 [Planctomycetia bacterium]|nr:hypothetical protein [Planctomycetia bacterium]